MIGGSHGLRLYRSSLEDVDPGGWSLIAEGRLANSCQLNRGTRRVIVRHDPNNEPMAYQLFSCALLGGNDQCSFERE